MCELAHVVREELATADELAQRVLDEEQEDDGEDEPRHQSADPVDGGFARVGQALERIQQAIRRRRTGRAVHHAVHFLTETGRALRAAFPESGSTAASSDTSL